MKTSRISYVVLGSLLISSAALAATTGSVTLGGTVLSSLEMSSTPTALASALDLSGGQKIALVADISMTTNNEQGLTLTASSGDLVKAGGTSIAFQVTSVDDLATAPVAGAFLVASGGDYTVGTSASGAVDKDLYILYTPLGLQDPGAYGATIDLAVTDN